MEVAEDADSASPRSGAGEAMATCVVASMAQSTCGIMKYMVSSIGDTLH